MKRPPRLAGPLFFVALGALTAPLGAQQERKAPPAPRNPPAKPAAADFEIQTEPPIQAALRALNTKTDLRVDRMPLDRFVEFLAKRYKLQVKLDRPALRWANIGPNARLTARCEQMPLRLALERALKPVGLKTRFVDGIVIVTAAEPTAKNADADEPFRLFIRRTLRSKTDLEVEIVPLEKLVRMLSLKYKIPFKLDLNGLERVGVDRSAPVSAQIEGMPLSAALRQILARYRLTYRVVGDNVFITNAVPEPAQARLQMDRRERMGAPVRPVLRGVVVGGQRFRRVGRPQLDALLEPLIKAELLFVKKVCAPTKEELEPIRKEVEAYVNNAHPGGATSAAAFLRPCFIEAVEKHLSRAKADRYQNELEKRTAFEREACVHSLVALLDRRLCLSTAQRQAISAALLSRWDDEWSPIVELVAVEGTALVPQLPDDLIESHLESAQLETWINLPKIGSLNWRFQSPDLSIMGVPVPDWEEE
jgi:hypothetical protein